MDTTTSNALNFRHTDKLIVDTDRDVLASSRVITDTVNNGINLVDRDILQGECKINENIKNAQFFVDNDVVQNRGLTAQGFAKTDANIVKGNYDQTNILRDNLNGVEDHMRHNERNVHDRHDRHEINSNNQRDRHYESTRDFVQAQFLANANTQSRYQTDLTTQGTASTLALSLANKDIQLGIERNFGIVAKDYEATKASIQANTSALQMEQQKLAAIQQLQSQTQFGSSQLEASKYHNATSMEQLRIKEQLQYELAVNKLEAEKHFGRVHEMQATSVLKLELDAQRNKAELLTKMQECCCEQKELTRATGEKTDTLIRHLEQTNLRDKLAESRQINIANAFNTANVSNVPRGGII
jgi:hypothetical protein